MVKILQYYNLETADAILQGYLSFMGKKVKLGRDTPEILKRIIIVLKKENPLKIGANKKYRVQFIFENITLDFNDFFLMNNHKFGLN